MYIYICMYRHIYLCIHVYIVYIYIDIYIETVREIWRLINRYHRKLWTARAAAVRRARPGGNTRTGVDLYG